jgi:hypothetical protein
MVAEPDAKDCSEELELVEGASGRGREEWGPWRTAGVV